MQRILVDGAWVNLGTGPPGIVGPLAAATKTADYLLTATDDIILADATSVAITLALPVASSRTRPYYIKRINGGANAVTIDANGAETIDGDLTAVLVAQWTSVTLVSDGTKWAVL